MYGIATPARTTARFPFPLLRYSVATFLLVTLCRSLVSRRLHTTLNTVFSSH